VIGDLDQSWYRLEVRHLVALETIARVGSFRAAARELGYSQSAISEQVNALEELIGERVLERSRGAKRVVPTQAGRVLLEHATRVGVSLVSARAELDALRAERETLGIGIFPSASARLLPSIVRSLRSERPELELRLHESDDPADLIELVLRGGLDAAFGTERAVPDALETAILLDDPYVLLVAADSGLARAAAVTPAEVARLPLVDYRSIRPELLPTSLLPRDARPQIVVRSDDQATVNALVAAGIGSAIVSRLGLVPGDTRVKAIPIEPPLPPRRVALHWLAARTPTAALTAFIEAAHASAADARGASPLPA
jgi:molybdate transport repressor ModE-like protein